MTEDHITIERLHVYAYHGVLPEEKEKGQNFYITLTMYLDTQRAGLTDSLDASVNYAEVCETVRRVVTEESYDLIEKVAETVAAAVLQEYPDVKGVDVKVSKPEAPVGMEVADIAVSIHREWTRCYLSYGSNLGESRELIEEGLRKLEESPYVRMGEKSKLIVTKPYGGVEQPDFLNGACRIDTLFRPHELLDCLHKIEAEAGRERLIHWGPRTLDMDILLYGDEVISESDLIIPHADMINRKFVLEPMCEIAPFVIHPICHKNMRELMADLASRE
ncbi:MAG: 2-amino-4-hydroxy-6-hydroxymethyldihydropteridine diphosphokinase [Lachnospiraceae bacterium]|nr:2-amino-4-hydroxy-6-hydroxymethyldihydropteridine diphosphokinase [Lachnospiraceae bacterium]